MKFKVKKKKQKVEAFFSMFMAEPRYSIIGVVLAHI